METTTLENISNETGLSLSWLRLQVREGNLTGERIGRIYVLPRTPQLTRFLASHKPRGTTRQSKPKQVDSLLDDV